MPAGVKTIAEPLSNELARREVLSAPQAVDIVRQLAHEISQRHEAGRLHLRIDADWVSYDSDTGRAELREPPDEARSFGGTDCGDEFCPPELQQSGSVLISGNVPAARDALQTAGLPSVDPCRVDVYQMGALLCRMVTDASVNDFLSRPRVAAKVVPELRELIERALGHNAQRAFRSAAELLQAMDAIDSSQTSERQSPLPSLRGEGQDERGEQAAGIGPLTPTLSPATEEREKRKPLAGLPNAQTGSTRNDAKPDTTPSFVGVGPADTDAGQPAKSLVESSGAALPFRKLGHYEIVGRLGHGGMGDVYKGYERRLDRHVAIKVLPAEFSRQEEMVKRFNAEASAAAKLVHPNTVEIYFIGEDVVPAAEGQPSSTVHFFTMQFVEGESLAELLARRKKLNVEETLAIIEQALAGLSAAHRLGMVHRDIKPGNILIDRQRQRVQLADFGLVKSLQGSGMTASGVIVGTADYMAPEQGRGGTVDARTDLYAVGVVLYQMLSGRLPFQADSVTAMIFQHVYETPPPLQDVATDIPEPLAAIVARLLSKSPDARYQNVGELLADLRAFHQGRPLSRHPAEAARPSDRPRTVIIPAPRFADEAVLPATLTQIETRDRWQQFRQSVRDFFLVPAAEAIQQLQTTENQVDGAIAEYERRHIALSGAVRDAETVAEELEAERETWRRAIAAAEQRAAQAADDETARAALGEKVRGQRVLTELAEQLESQQSQLAEMRRNLSQIAATLERLRSQRDVLNARLKVARAQIRLAGGQVSAVRGSRWIARIRWRNVAGTVCLLLVAGVATTVLAKLLASTSFIQSWPISISPEAVTVRVNDELAAANTPEKLYATVPKAFGLPFSESDTIVTVLAVSPTGAHVAAATGGPTVFLWDAESGKLLHRLTENLREVQALSFNSDGTVLATGESRRAIGDKVKLWNVETGQLLGSLPAKTAIRGLAFSPNKPLLAVVDSEHPTSKVTLWNIESRTQDWTFPIEQSMRRIVFSPDGSLLAALAENAELFVLDINEKKLLKSWFLSSNPVIDVVGPVFTPDSSQLLTSHEVGAAITAINTWDARTGERRSQTGGGISMRVHTASVAMSKDGRWLTTSSGKGEGSDTVGQWITILDAQSGLARAVIPGHQTLVLAFSPKGNRLFSAGGHPYLMRWEIKPQSLKSKGPTYEIAAGPVLAMARDKPMCFLNVGSKLGIWNYQTRSPLFPLRSESIPPLKRFSAALTSDARRAALLDSDGRLRVWDVVTAEQIRDVRIPDDYNFNTESAVAFSADSEMVWIAASKRLWRLELKQTTPEPWMDWPPGTAIATVSPDGKFAAASNKQLHAWDVATRQPILPSEDFPFLFSNFAFARNSRWMIGLHEDGELFHWDLERRKLLSRFRILPSRSELSSNEERVPERLAFMPNPRFALAVRLPRLRVIDLEAKEEIAQFHGTLKGDPSPLIHVSHDGRFAVTSDRAADRIAFWDLFTHEKLGN